MLHRPGCRAETPGASGLQRGSAARRRVGTIVWPRRVWSSGSPPQSHSRFGAERNHVSAQLHASVAERREQDRRTESRFRFRDDRSGFDRRRRYVILGTAPRQRVAPDRRPGSRECAVTARRVPDLRRDHRGNRHRRQPGARIAVRDPPARRGQLQGLLGGDGERDHLVRTSASGSCSPCPCSLLLPSPP